MFDEQIVDVHRSDTWAGRVAKGKLGSVVMGGAKQAESIRQHKAGWLQLKCKLDRVIWFNSN